MNRRNFNKMILGGGASALYLPLGLNTPASANEFPEPLKLPENHFEVIMKVSRKWPSEHSFKLMQFMKHYATNPETSWYSALEDVTILQNQESDLVKSELRAVVSLSPTLVDTWNAETKQIIADAVIASLYWQADSDIATGRWPDGWTGKEL